MNRLIDKVRWDDGKLVLLKGYTMEQYLRDRAEAIARQEARMKERGREAVTLCENLRCKDADRLKQVVEAFVKRRDSGATVEDFDRRSSQRVFIIRQGGWILGSIVVSPINDEQFEFSLTRAGHDFPDGLGPDFEAMKKLFDALVQRLRMEYGAPTEAKSARQRQRVRGVSPDILHDCTEVMEKWLDRNMTLRQAARDVGRDDETVLRHIPDVLETIDDPAKLDRWIKLICRMGKTRYLGIWSPERR